MGRFQIPETLQDRACPYADGAGNALAEVAARNANTARRTTFLLTLGRLRG